MCNLPDGARVVTVTGLSVYGGTIALGDALGRIHVFDAGDFLSVEGTASD
jgi:hypothetical protein